MQLKKYSSKKSFVNLSPKPYFLAICLTVFFTVDSLAGCLSDTAILNTQADIDSFQSNFAVDGLCQTLSLLRVQRTDVQNLDGLSDLRDVDAVQITDNFQLDSINGIGMLQSSNELILFNNQSLSAVPAFDDLQSIERLIVRQNSILETISGFNQLTNIDYLLIEENPSLREMNGFLATTSAGPMTFSSNPQLTQLPEFQNLLQAESLVFSSNSLLAALPTFSKLVLVSGRIEIDNNAALQQVSGFESLQSIASELVISRNSALDDIEGFNQLELINGALTFSSNSAQESFTGFSKLNEINGRMLFESLDALTELSGFEQLTKLNRLQISNNLALQGIEAFTSLREAESLSIGDNPQLEAIADWNELAVSVSLDFDRNAKATNLPSLHSITSLSSLAISYNAQLTTLEGLNNLEHISGGIVINDNPSLISLGALNQLMRIEGEPGFLSIRNNDSLPNLTGLDSLVAIDGELTLEANPDLTDISALENLRAIDALYISDMHALSSLLPLEGLSGNLQNLTLLNNEALTSTAGLEGVRPVADIIIVNNPNLLSLSGLQQTSGRIGLLEIQKNSLLPSLSGLENVVEAFGRRLVIAENSSLSNCSALTRVLDSVDDGSQGFGLRAIPDAPLDIKIFSNPPGCNSIDEILFGVDSDGDGISNANDNCPNRPNPRQDDDNGNGVGNDCQGLPSIINNLQTLVAEPDQTISAHRMILGAQEQPQIIYFNQSAGSLHLLSCDDLACETSFDSQLFSSAALQGDSVVVALTIDDNGNPFVAFGNVTEGYLKAGKCDDRFCTAPPILAHFDESLTESGRLNLIISTNGLPSLAYQSNLNILTVISCNEPTCLINGYSKSDLLGQTRGNGFKPDMISGTSGYAIIANGVIKGSGAQGGIEITQCNDDKCADEDETRSVFEFGDGGEKLVGGSALAIDGMGRLLLATASRKILQNASEKYFLQFTRCADTACSEEVTVFKKIDPLNGIGTGNMAMKLDQDEFPVIAYQRALYKDLLVAKCMDRLCSESKPLVSIVDDDLNTVADDIGMVIGSDGLPFITYSDSTDGTIKSVKCATSSCSTIYPGTEPGLISVDGFEN